MTSNGTTASLMRLKRAVSLRFGQHADIRDEQGNTYRCHIRRVVDSLVCGDIVQWARATTEQQGMQGRRHPRVHQRQSLLSRPDYYDGLKPGAIIDSAKFLSYQTYFELFGSNY